MRTALLAAMVLLSGASSGARAADPGRELHPDERAAVLRAAALSEMARAAIDPDDPALMARLSERTEQLRAERHAREAIALFADRLARGDLPQAGDALAEARLLGAPESALQPMRRQLALRRAQIVAGELFEATEPLLLALLLAWGLTRVVGWLLPGREPLPPRFNPYLAGRPIRDPALFFGREVLLADVLGRLRRGRAVVLSGERRIGKTSLLLAVGRAWRDAGGRELYVDLEGSRARGPGEAVRDALAREAARAGLDPSGDLAALAARLGAQGPPLLLALDEIDAYNEAPAAELAALRAAALDQRAPLAVLMAGVELGLNDPGEAAAWRRLVDDINVAPLDETAARQLFLAPVTGIVSYDDGVVAEVLRRSQGRPMRVQLFGLHLVDRLGVAGRTRATAEDLKAVVPSVERAWNAIQDSGMTDQSAPLELDAALYEIARLKQEIALLERELRGEA